jgi:exodeoxyribonuclease-3
MDGFAMKIINWNCNLVFRNKHKRVVDDFDPDIMIIQECEEPDMLRRMIDNQYEILWMGDNKYRGFSIVFKNSLKVKPLPIEPGGVRYMFPVEMDSGFKIIAFWAMNNQVDRMQRYIGQVWVGLNKCMEFLDDKTIVLGDFGWNASWERSMLGPLYGNLDDVVGLLKRYRIESAYHYVRGEEFGAETEKTFYDNKRIGQAFHTDYMFVPTEILNHTKQFTVGKYKDWIEPSDHMPLFIEF